MSLTVEARGHPQGDATAKGPYTLAAGTDCICFRASGRIFAFRLSAAGAGFRLGRPVFDAVTLGEKSIRTRRERVTALRATKASAAGRRLRLKRLRASLARPTIPPVRNASPPSVRKEMSHTIYIRSRPAAFAVVVKPNVSGLNQLLIESHAAARTMPAGFTIFGAGRW